jgi:hypothetical protein
VDWPQGCPKQGEVECKPIEETNLSWKKLFGAGLGLHEHGAGRVAEDGVVLWEYFGEGLMDCFFHQRFFHHREKELEHIPSPSKDAIPIDFWRVIIVPSPYEAKRLQRDVKLQESDYKIVFVDPDRLLTHEDPPY